MPNKIKLITYNPILYSEEGKGLLPATGHSDDAGIDCYALEDFELPPLSEAGEGLPSSTPIRLGFGIKMPKRSLLDRLTNSYWHAEITGRSSQNKQGILVLRGIVDQSYTGEYVAFLVNLNNHPVAYSKGERICQLLFYKERKVTGNGIRVLKKGKREKGGFGSTGR